MSRFVAVVGRRGRFLVAEPLFDRGPQLGLSGGVRVRGGELVEIETAGRGGRVVALLGDPSRAADVVAALPLDRGLERGFAPGVEDEAREAAVAALDRDPARRDLTELATFTVDPASAHDFDDAVSADRAGDDAIRLWIHIADVAAHVRPGGALDDEARRRANSTYVPGHVEPMLPAALSAEACSLAPGVERLAVTAEILVGADGTARSSSFYRSRIRSDHRLSYDDLDEHFAGRSAPPQTIAQPLELARGVAAALAERRAGGGLEVETAEPEFEFDSGGAVIGARSVVQTEAHRLIEQLMILTNELVAEDSVRRGVPTLYRVHERPEPARVVALVEQLAALDLPTPAVPESPSPQQASELAIEASRLVARDAERRGHGRAAYTSLVLRAMKPALYSDRNLGHAGLGSRAYCHFTSPIRRYPDLIVHRALLSGLGADETQPERAEVREAAAWCSERERESMVIERDADKVCAAFLLERELQESDPRRVFGGEVSGVIGAGAFVAFAGELGDAYEGFLPARRIRDDRYDLNQTETALVGRRSRREIRLGDPVEVRVDGVEAARGRVDLIPAGGSGPGR